ncbi:MAG: DNA primase small subunit domain-containing protein [Candidatus Thorarchaeota archaeon]
MTDTKFLERLFQAYYLEKKDELPLISLFKKREFGFIPWQKPIMIRHIGFTSKETLLNYFINNPPKHAYTSGSIYEQPEAPVMDRKIYRGCDLIIDIDVDHFYTSCKDRHDLWHCKECGTQGTGMPEKCPKCGKVKFSKLNWVCNECLKTAKTHIQKLVYNFLIPDFDLKEEEMKIAFSGHRGYHLKIENNDIRTLSSDERREITDFLTAENISFEILGLRNAPEGIYGISKENIGWSQKILKKIEELIKLPDPEIETLLLNKRMFDLNPKLVQSFINYKNDFYQQITNKQRNIWAIEGFGINLWKKFLQGIVQLISIELDEPVTIDIHRLIRYPGSLHGKTGFKVQEITLNDLDGFSPLNEQNSEIDPIVFMSKKHINQKLEIIEDRVPPTTIKGETLGPYKKGEKIDVPHHFAVFLLCKEVAKTL